MFSRARATEIALVARNKVSRRERRERKMNGIYVNRIERQVYGLEEATGLPAEGTGQKANVINRPEGLCREYEILLTLSLCLALCDATSVPSLRVV
jgi:hypothetical protein